MMSRISDPSRNSRLYYRISRRVGDAIGMYDMIQEGDRIVVALSGGKDSMTLLEMLLYRQRFAPVKYELMAVWIDMDIPGFPREELVSFMKTQKVPFVVESGNIAQGGRWEDVNCYHCAQLRRKFLFQLADREGFNKIALGHHLDDIAETIAFLICDAPLITGQIIAVDGGRSLNM